MKNTLLVVILLIVITITSTFSSTVIYANNNNDNREDSMDATMYFVTLDNESDQIEELFSKLGENIALSLLDGAGNYVDETRNIEKKLSDLGVEEISAQDIEVTHCNKINLEKKPERLRVRKPSDTDTVKWFRKTYKNIEYGTKKYDVQVLKAMGKNEGVLVTGRDNEEFFSGQQKIIKGVSELVSIYAQKLVALIPIVTWLPYELSFANTEKDVVNSSYVTHRSVSTIEFTYVKESGLPNSCYILTRNSNRIQIATLAHGAGVSGSKPFTYAKKKIGTIKSKSFGNRLDAIKKYSEKISYYDYVPCYTIYSYDKKYSSKYYVPNPLAPGGIC